MLLVNLAVLTEQPTGISIYAQNVVPHLGTLNAQILSNNSHQLTLNPGGKIYPIPAGMSPHFGLKGHAKRLGWTQFTLPKLYRQLNANLIFSPLPEAPLYTDCRTVIMVHDLIPLRYPDRRSPLQYYQKFVLPRVLQQAEHLVCNSQATANDVIDFFGISANKITPIPLAYDAQHFRVIEHLQPPAKPYFLYLGRHNPYKNLPRMIRAFANLKNYLPNHQDYEFWLVGSFDKRYTPELIKLIAELGLEKQVLFKDYIPHHDLPRVINQALCLLFATLWEGFGLPVLEAIACGTPVITANQSSLPEVVGDAALLVNPNNIAEITDAMQAIATQDELRQSLIEQGLAQAQKFSWAKTGAQTAALLERFL
jgi:glycosyltransferase involved in cell wall biosynthesis